MNYLQEENSIWLRNCRGS